MTRRKLTEGEFRRLVNRLTPGVVKKMTEAGELDPAIPKHKEIIDRWLKTECDDGPVRKRRKQMPSRKRGSIRGESLLKKTVSDVVSGKDSKSLREEKRLRQERKEKILAKIRERRKLRAEQEDEEVDDKIPDDIVPPVDIDDEDDEEKGKKKNDVDINISVEQMRRRRKLREALKRHREKRAGGDERLNPTKKLIENRIKKKISEGKEEAEADKTLDDTKMKPGENILEWYGRTRKGVIIEGSGVRGDTGIHSDILKQFGRKEKKEEK